MSTLSEPRRPRLLPQNRKLRHLKGLSLRNLTFALATLYSADDAVIPGSPSKLGMLREAAHLHTSRSSDSLRRDGLRPEKRRPPPQPRRTSLSLSHANPSTRQKRLESLVQASVGDVFFSLHVAECEEPIYISEVRNQSANFNFQFFDLSADKPLVSRSCTVSIRVWAKRPQQTSWVFLLQEFIDLRRLNFIGTLIDRQFPPNAIILHLEDGVYSLDFPTRTADPKHAPPAAATSSYNALMKLANLESSIQDAIDTQHRITQQINQILEKSPSDPTPAADEEVSLAGKFVATQQRANKTARRRRDEMMESLRSRREAISIGREAQAAAEKDIANNKEKLAASIALLHKTEQQIRGQRRRICSELSDIFPITPLPNAPPLSFQICNLPLPNSTYDAATARTINEDVLSAALGLVATLTRHLQFYLSCPLPYPLSACGSRSYARDDISHIPERQPQRREFPLYLPRGGSTIAQWRFEYGWFLLNKNIEALCASQGLKVVDIRHSLPNLKYLLYVCSAGTDEVPERKKGGVRGLWAGRLKGRMGAAADAESGSSAGDSRRGSVDSEVANQHGEALRSAAVQANGDGDGGWGADSGVGLLPFGDDARFTLRTKGLRENVA
ncbi:p63 protein [Metarhizium brunneum]